MCSTEKVHWRQRTEKLLHIQLHSVRGLCLKKENKNKTASNSRCCSYVLMLRQNARAVFTKNSKPFRFRLEF